MTQQKKIVFLFYLFGIELLLILNNPILKKQTFKISKQLLVIKFR